MLDAMKSLLGGSVGSYAPQQLQPQTDSNNQQRKEQQSGTANNPAVEINLSAQARRIMEALEKGELKLDEQGRAHREEAAPQFITPANDEKAEEIAGPFAPLNELIDDIINEIETGLLSREEISKIGNLFNEIEAVLDGQAEGANIVSDANGLSVADQFKAMILYSELNRLLGNVGVFFGRDLSMAKMSADAQDTTTQMFDELASTLGAEKVGKMRSPQEARVDAIFRELEQLYAAARSNLPESQSREITDFFTKISRKSDVELGY